MGLALKALLDRGSPVHGFVWDLPVQGESGEWIPGAWHEVPGTVEYRRRGLHVCGSSQVAYWRGHLGAKGAQATVWVAEYSGAVSVGKNGWAAQSVRLLRPWQGEEIEGLAPRSYSETLSERVAELCPALSSESVARVADCLASLLNDGARGAGAAKRKTLATAEKRAVTKALKSR